MKKITGGKQIIVAQRGRILSPKRTEYGKSIRKEYEAGNVKEKRKNIQQLEPRTDGISNTLTGVQKDNLVLIENNIQVKSGTKDGFETAQPGDSINLSMPNSKTRRGRVGVGVAQTLDTQANQSVLLQGNIRRLTEIECERLQGFPDDWTKYGNYDGEIKEISRTQRYKMCGNAVTRDVVELIGRKLLNPS